MKALFATAIAKKYSIIYRPGVLSRWKINFFLITREVSGFRLFSKRSVSDLGILPSTLPSRVLNIYEINSNSNYRTARYLRISNFYNRNILIVKGFIST